MLTVIFFSRIQQGAVLRRFLRAQVLIYAAKPLFPLTEQSDPDAPFPMVKLHLHPQESGFTPQNETSHIPPQEKNKTKHSKKQNRSNEI